MSTISLNPEMLQDMIQAAVDHAFLRQRQMIREQVEEEFEDFLLARLIDKAVEEDDGEYVSVEELKAHLETLP